MKVAQIMSSPLISVMPDTGVPEVARLMQRHRIGAVGVLDEDGTLAGLITESDFVEIMRLVPFTAERAPVLLGVRAATAAELESIWTDARSLTARELMKPDVYTIPEHAEVGVVVRAMLGRDVKHVPVMRGDRPVGMVARHDILKLALRTLNEETG